MKIVLAALIVASCSFKKNPLENQIPEGHSELYSRPDAPKLEKLTENEKRIVIAATNDIHGSPGPHAITFKDSHSQETHSTKLGGTALIQDYFDILRDTYKNVVLVDSGDIFSSASAAKKIQNFYSKLKYDAITVGLSDFNLKLPAEYNGSSDLFKDFAKNSSVPLLLSNLYELKTARVVEWKGVKPYQVKEVNGVKVGIIGLIPNDIVPNTPVQNRVGLFIENMIQSTMRYGRLLRSMGTEIIVVLVHQDLDCYSKLGAQSKLPPMKVNFEPKRSDICNLKNPLGEYIGRLPPDLVDVVVGGRNHQKVANYINGVLVMSGFPDGKSFSHAELIVDTKNKKVNHEKTVVHQPVLFCHEFFKETNDCFHEDPTVNHKDRKPAYFLGKEIKVPTETAKSNSEEFFVSLARETLAKTLLAFNADISYFPNSRGSSHLQVLSIKGKDLIRILEEEYNIGKKDHWYPDPFYRKKNEITLSISGEDIGMNNDYRILADIESIQNHYSLKNFLSAPKSKSLVHFSWDSFSDEADSVNTQLAAGNHRQ